MGGNIHIEVLLAICYAGFLMAVAGVLELAARYSHRRSARFRVAGFRYDPKLDLWICPNDQNLLRAEVNYQRNIVIYRAAPHTCNSCAMRTRCTDSTHGRTIEHAPDSWLYSELRRFHRGISLMLFTLAAVMLLIEFFRYRDSFERILLAGAALLISGIGVRISARPFTA